MLWHFYAAASSMTFIINYTTDSLSFDYKANLLACREVLFINPGRLGILKSNGTIESCTNLQFALIIRSSDVINTDSKE